MDRKQWVTLSVIAFAAAFFAWLAWSSRQPPLLPDDDAHATFVSAGTCFECHGPETQEAGLELHRENALADVLKNRKAWDKVYTHVKIGAMPPSSSTQPKAEEREKVVAWLDHSLHFVDCTGGADPGRVTIRRLNRAEYNNTIRDLVGVDFHPADDFPADDVGYGFDNIGDVLSMPPILLEKYLAAAERVLEEAIVVTSTQPRVKQFAAVAMDGTAQGGAYTSDVRSMTTKGELFVDYIFPATGEYTVRVRAFQQGAGEQAAKLALRLGDAELKSFDVESKEQSPKVFEAKVKVEAGSMLRISRWRLHTAASKRHCSFPRPSRGR